VSAKQEFLRLLRAFMAGGPERPIDDFLQKRLRQDPAGQQECLEAFIGVSATYGIEKRSMTIFWGLSSMALASGDPFFALKYEYLVRPEAHTQWSERFAFLADYQKEEERRQIAAKKAKATYLDHRRLQLFQEQEEDIQAAKQAKPKPRSAPVSKARKQFLALFERYMLERSKAATVELTEFIQRRLGPTELEECLLAYLDASERYSLTQSPAKDFSLSIFYGMASLALHRCGGYFALKFELWTKPEEKTAWGRRYERLRPDQQEVLARDLAAAKKRTRVLDELKFAYYGKHRKDPDERALRTFDPVPSEDLRHKLLTVLARCDHYADKLWIFDFGKAWDEVAALYQQKELLALLQLLKWTRGWLEGDKAIRDELYWYGVGALLDHLLRWHPEAYQRGFDRDEKAFLLSTDLARHPYYGDFEDRLYYLTTTRDFGKFAGVAKVHAVLELHAVKRHMTLATMADTKRAYRLLEQVREHGPKKGQQLRIPVKQPENLLKDQNATVAVGDSYGDLTIVWLDGDDTAYLESRRLEGVLFIMYETEYSHQLGQLSQDKFYDVLWEQTQHLLVLIPAFFQVLMFLPDLVSGGLSGLARSVAQQYLIGEVTERVFGDDPAGQVFAIAATALTGHLTQPQSPANRAIAAELRAAELAESALVVPKGVQVRIADQPPGQQAPPHPLDAPPGAARIEDQHPGVRTGVQDEHLVADAGTETRTAPAPKEPTARPVLDDDVAPPRPGGPEVSRQAELEQLEQQHELLAADAGGGKGSPKKKAAGPPKKQAKPPPSRRVQQPQRQAAAGDTGGEGVQSQSGAGDRARGDKGTGDRGKANPGTGAPGGGPVPPRAPRRRPRMRQEMFVRGGVQYRISGTEEHWDALVSNTATRYQVYEIRNAAGETVYVGIAGGITQPKDAVDRLHEHLYTKAGEFIGDADTIVIRGVDLDERVARALEDHLIDEHAPWWNKRSRDPQSYQRKYGMKPTDAEVQLANNALLRFKIKLLP
jgi:hypothetical protein